MKAPKTELISRAGVYFSGYALSMSGMIFRETSSSDVGVDGQIELVDDDGSATGMLAGVQIKSGNSFVDCKEKAFSFKSSREHYKYWEKLKIPTIGIVFSPELETASWFILENHSKEIIKNNASCSITQKIELSNELSIKNSPCRHLINYILKYYNKPITKNELNNFDYFSENIEIKPSDSEKLISWKRMISAFFSSKSSPEIIYDVGYRLSWYFPTVTEEQRILFKKRLNKITVLELQNVLKGVIFANENNCERGFELIMNLLNYKVDIIDMLVKLKNSSLPDQQEVPLIQEFIEYFEQDR